MLSATPGFPGDMSRRSVLPLEVLDFKAFCESGHNLFKNIVEHMK